MDQNNPLSQFYRVPKFSVKLPSRGAYYEENAVIDVPEDGEVPVLPMTAADETIMKNPDALLNGEAVMAVIKSCVPCVKTPKKLLSCDVDALMVGIRAASYEEQNEISAKCPSCGAENHYAVDFEALLESVEPLESHYEVVLGSGVTVTVVPSSFDLVIKQQRGYFEGTRIQRSLEDRSLSEESRLRMFTEAFNKINKLNFELVLDSIKHIVAVDQEGKDLVVDNRKQISEFIRNIEGRDVKLIEKTIRQMNSHGVKKEMGAVCRACGHEWEMPVEFSDTNFS